MSRHVVVMVTSSYPRFPGDAIGSFMEPIAKGVALRGHEVYVVAPWHPAVTRAEDEDGVHFYFYRYAPVRALNVFGYAASLGADVRLNRSAYLAAPFALASGARMARKVRQRHRATVVHGHWVIPNGPLAALAAGRSTPLVLSLHGSDVFLAEQSRLASRAARWTFGRARAITACSDDLRARACRFGAPADRIETLPYGVNAQLFRPNPEARRDLRLALGVSEHAPLLFTAGRLVSKKGFEYLLYAMPEIARAYPDVRLIIAGSGDLNEQLRGLARKDGLENRVIFPGMLSHGAVAQHLAAADVIVVPSIKDDAGNVDGLPNLVLEALASETSVVTTAAGGIGRVATDDTTAVVVPERDAHALAAAIQSLLADPARRRRLGQAARRLMIERHSWAAVAARLEGLYDLSVAEGSSWPSRSGGRTVEFRPRA